MGRIVVGDERDMELHLFGGFDLRAGGRSVELSPGAQRLIGFLALHGRPARRPYVSGRLWPDATESRAAACLRSALCRLRVAEVAPVVAGAGRLWLAPAMVVD